MKDWFRSLKHLFVPATAEDADRHAVYQLQQPRDSWLWRLFAARGPERRRPKTAEVAVPVSRHPRAHQNRSH